VGFTTIILIFLLPETSHTNILLRRAERLRAVTGDQSYKSQTEIARGDKDFGQVLSFALIKPFEVSRCCCMGLPAPLGHPTTPLGHADTTPLLRRSRLRTPPSRLPTFTSRLFMPGSLIPFYA
jgi:hypothetical protein